MTNLRDTVNLMNSEDYKERFIAEYWQTKIRYEKLRAFNTRIEAAKKLGYRDVLDTVKLPQIKTPYDIFSAQQDAMAKYLHLLELRAVFEDIDLNFFDEGDSGTDDYVPVGSAQKCAAEAEKNNEGLMGA